MKINKPSIPAACNQVNEELSQGLSGLHELLCHDRLQKEAKMPWTLDEIEALEFEQARMLTKNQHSKEKLERHCILMLVLNSTVKAHSIAKPIK